MQEGKARIATLAILIGGLGIILMVGRCSTGASEPVHPASSVATEAALPPTCTLTRPAPVVRNTSVTALCDRVYAEEGLAPAELDSLKSAWQIASRNLAVAFETVRSTPVVVFCRSAECKMSFGAPTEAAAANDFGFASAQLVFEDGSLAPSAVVVTAPVEATPRILTHEMIHAEMKAWVDFDRLPTWFTEGTATFLAGEPRCEPNAPNDIDVKLLATKAQWQRHLRKTHRTHDTYCAARHEVERWLTPESGDHARAEAIRALMISVAEGTPFDSAFAAAH